LRRVLIDVTAKNIKAAARIAIIKYKIFPIGLLNKKGIEMISRAPVMDIPIIE